MQDSSFHALRRPRELRVACIGCGAERHVRRDAIAGDICLVCDDPGWLPVRLIEAVFGAELSTDPVPDLFGEVRS